MLTGKLSLPRPIGLDTDPHVIGMSAGEYPSDRKKSLVECTNCAHIRNTSRYQSDSIAAVKCASGSRQVAGAVNLRSTTSSSARGERATAISVFKIASNGSFS